MASTPQLLSGARGLILNGTNILAITTDITINVRHNVRPTYVLGDMNAAAIDSITYDVDVSIGRVIPMNSAHANTDLPAGTVTGSNAEISAISVGLEPVLATMISANDINIILQDRVTGATIGSVQGCRFSGRSMSTNATDIASERLNFVGIYDAGYAGQGGTPDNSATGGYGVS